MEKIFRKVLILLLDALVPFSTAGAYQFTHINTGNSGLSYDGISNIMQDSRGFIWVGTYKGLNRYDGTSFKNYYKEDLGLSTDFVFTVAEDHDGDLWIGTDNGATRYNYLKDCFEPLDILSDKGTRIHNKVTFIFVDSSNLIWMLVNNQGVFCYDKETDSLSMKPYTEFGDVIGFRKMLRMTDGSTYMSCYHLNLFQAGPDLENFRTINLGEQSGYFINDEIEGIFMGHGSHMYVASTKNGISLVDTGRHSVTPLFRIPLRDATLLDSFMEGDRFIWLSTSRGVWRYDILTGASLSLSEDKGDRFSISGEYVCCTFVDSDGGLWIGTKDGGISYCGAYQNNFEKQYKASGISLQGALVSGFAADENGNVWVTTEQGGLLRYDIEGHATTAIEDMALRRTTCSPCMDGQYLWLGSLQGLLRFDTKSRKVKDYGILKRSSGVNDPRVYLVYKTRNGDLFAGTTLGIFKYDRVSDTFVDIDVFDGIFLTGAAEDADGRLWLSSFAKGVYCWDYLNGSLPVHYSSSSGCGLVDDKVSSVFVDSRNRVWAVGFSHGIARFDAASEKFMVYDHNTLPSLPSDVYFRMVEDQSGQFWMASDAGLVQFNPDTFEVKVYSKLDGLLDTKFTNSAYRIPSGDMFFGSDNGFIRFDPLSLYSDERLPAVAISALVIADSVADLDYNIDLASQIELTREQRSFGFRFSLLGAFPPASLRIQCRLDGHESQWHDIVGDKSVFYYNVKPGNYTLLLRAATLSGEWQDVHEPLRVTLKPGFWLSATGILLMIVLVFGAMAFLYFILQRRERRQRESEEKEYRRRKDEEMFQEKLNFFSHVIHEIKTPLTLIKTPLNNVVSKDVMDSEVRHDLTVMMDSADYLSRLVNELLDFVRVEKKGYVLNPERINIVDRIGSLIFDYVDTARNSNLRLDFIHEMAGAWIFADSAAVDKILNNLLINAVKYAESFIEVKLSVIGNGLVEVRFSNDGPMIPEEYRDEIFKPFVQFKDGAKQSAGGVGIGLPLSRNLARMQSGTLELDTGDGRTCFILTLPLESDAASVSEGDIPAADDSEGKPCLLIADDNKELREYLMSKLSDTYDVIAVSNGNAVMRTLGERSVDFLLTDISMPGKTGLEICREIRDNIEISHLPVIILSARSSVESKIQAMESGADLYIEKPFDLEYLKTSIRNILDRRLLMKKAFGRGIISADIDMFGLPKKDEQFFGKFDTAIRENLSSTDLGVEWLSERMGMSQSTLTRKIRKLMNTTPNNYIRSVRLSVAASMLKDSHGNNISDICYATGFSNLSYFAKCFKEQYGVNPTEYASGTIPAQGD